MTMKRIVDYGEISPLVLKYFKRGVVTNNFLSADEYKHEIAEERLFYDSGDTFLNFYLKRDGFSRLYFYTFEDRIVTEAVEPLICEVAEKMQDVAEESGFSKNLTRVQLERNPDAVSGGITVGEVCCADEVYELLQSCFDRRTGFIPTLSELRDDCDSGHIYALRENDELSGVLRWNKKGNVSCIKHICVREGLRGKGVGRKLCGAFLSENGNNKCSVWTGSGNAPALALYKSFGFSENGIRSIVYMKG